MERIRVALADDEALFRRGLGMILSAHEQIDVLFEAEDGQDLLNQLETAETLPEIVILDLKMPGLNGIETAKILKRDFEALQFIVLSTHFSKAFVVNMVEIGAAAYLPKNSEPALMIQTILSVKEKGFFYTQEVMEVIRDYMANKQVPKQEPLLNNTLTNREKEVLGLICNQYTSSEIADKLFISRRTVEGHRNNLLMKLGCRNVAGLVAYALEHDMVQIDPTRVWE